MGRCARQRAARPRGKEARASAGALRRDLFTATRGGADREPEAVRGLVRARAVGVFLGVARVALALVDDALALVALAGVLLAAAALAGAAATVRVWAAARLFAGRTAVALFGDETLPVAGAPRAGVLARRSMLRMVATVRTFVSLRFTRCLVNHAGQTSKV